MGATILYYTDRQAATVVEIINPKTIVVQNDTATRKNSNSQSECQTWEYTPNTAGQKHTFTLRKNGTWVEAHSKMRNGTIVHLGKRDNYYDFGF